MVHSTSLTEFANDLWHLQQHAHGVKLPRHQSRQEWNSSSFPKLNYEKEKALQIPYFLAITTWK